MRRRASAVALMAAIASAACLSSVNTDPHGYRCDADSDCTGGLRCLSNRCVDPSPYTLPVYRLNSTHDLGQLLTGDAGWVAALVDAGTYTSEGVVFRALELPQPYAFDVYALHRVDTNDWLYTTNNGERTHLLAESNWEDHGTAFYSRAVGDAGLSAVNRMTHDAYHHWAVGDAEFNEMVANGYKYDNSGDAGPSIWVVLTTSP